MGTRSNTQFTRSLPELRYEPTPKRVRARAGHETWVDSTRAVIVWEPGRVVPSYAVPDAAGFRPADADLAGLVVLDFAIFDEWLEEDEPIVGHPRDPFKRIDVRRSSRHVTIGVDGVTLADSTRAQLLFETWLPPRSYIPRDDVRMELLTPSDTRSICAYKGHASYWSVEAGGRLHRDLAWTYERPLSDATQVTDHIAFFDERADVTVDGELRPRPVTPWS